MVPSWVHSTRERPSKVWTAPSFITQRKRHSTMVASSRWKKRPLSQTSTRPRVFHSWNQ